MNKDNVKNFRYLFLFCVLMLSLVTVIGSGGGDDDDNVHCGQGTYYDADTGRYITPDTVEHVGLARHHPVQITILIFFNANFHAV